MELNNSKDYAAITSVDQLAKLADQMLAEGKPIGFDTETGYYGADFAGRALDHYNDNQFTVGFSFTNDSSWARYVPLAHDPGGNIDSVSDAWEAVREMLTKGHIVSFHQKFERAGVLKAAGIKLGAEGKVSDPMLAAYVLGMYYNKSWRTIVGLKELVAEVYQHQMMQIHDLWPELPKNRYKLIRFNSLEVTPAVVAYACEDAAFMPPLEKDLCIPAEKENPFMYALEHRIADMMVEVERYGVEVDWDGIEHAYAEAQMFIPEMEAFVKRELGEMVGRDLSEMNLNSSAQKQKLLFDELGFTTTRKSKITGKMSAGKKSLEGLAKEHKAIRDLLEYGEVANLRNRLRKWLAEYTHSPNKRIHANYNQVQVPSGRFAANEPAIQQLPKKWLWLSRAVDFDPDKKENKTKVEEFKSENTNGLEYWAGNFRNFIIAAADHYLITFDFSQAELRVLAGASQEPSLLHAFEVDDDIHAATAATVFGIPLDEVTYDQRQKGKTTNFAILYGQGPKALGEQLGISFEEAKELYTQYFASLPFVTAWYNQAKRNGFRNGYTKTIFSRKVPIWELLSDTRTIQSKGERVIINSEIQGGVADYVKFIMIQARKALIDANLWDNGVMMTMNQHDALTFECHNSVDPNHVRQILEPVVVLNPEKFAPLKAYPQFRADWELGQRWGSSDSWKSHQKAIFDGEHWAVEAEVELSSLQVEITYAPTEKEFKHFISTLKEKPGNTKVQFVCPGEDFTLPITSSVTKSDSRTLQKMFKDAIIRIG